MFGGHVINASANVPSHILNIVLYADRGGEVQPCMPHGCWYRHDPKFFFFLIMDGNSYILVEFGEYSAQITLVKVSNNDENSIRMSSLQQGQLSGGCKQQPKHGSKFPR